MKRNHFRFMLGLDDAHLIDATQKLTGLSYVEGEYREPDRVTLKCHIDEETAKMMYPIVSELRFRMEYSQGEREYETYGDIKILSRELKLPDRELTLELMAYNTTTNISP